MIECTLGESNIEIDLVRQHKLKSALQRTQTAQAYYFIDIVGNCNLRCPSCPMGQNYSGKPKGMMKLDKFQRILDKIVKECNGLSVFVDLYNWAEPLLHPNAADFVREVKKRGMKCGISSNLSLAVNLRDLIKAGPDYIRVSLSGYNNDVYQKTHVGGDINVVKSNLYMLRHLIDKYKKDTIVQIGFHIYRSNFPNSFLKMLQLSEELGFLFAPTLATLMPVEAVVDLMDGENAVFADTLLADLVATPAEWKKIYDEEGLYLPDCQYRKLRTTINFDGSVALCCAVFEDVNYVCDDFESHRQKEIDILKYQMAFCERCMSHKMHMMYTGCLPEVFHHKAGEVLGDIYQDWHNLTKHLGSSDHVVIEREVLTIQEVYDRAMQHRNSGDKGLKDADRLFAALIDMAPHFGEAFFQGAVTAKYLGNLPLALLRIQQAVKSLPDHAGYRAELQEIERLMNGF
jgi:hypothetical protein